MLQLELTKFSNIFSKLFDDAEQEKKLIHLLKFHLDKNNLQVLTIAAVLHKKKPYESVTETIFKQVFLIHFKCNGTN